jgi:hypothetical protein
VSDERAEAQRYFDTLIESYDILAQAAKQASTHGIKLGQQLSDDVAAAQREALQVAKNIAADPGDVGKAYNAMLESTLSAQGRALNFAQLMTQEALDASGETRQALDRLTKANRQTAEAAVAAFRDFASTGGVPEFFKQAMSTWSQREPAGAKEAS